MYCLHEQAPGAEKAHKVNSRKSQIKYGALVTKLCPRLATPWIVAHHVPLSMGFSRQEYWSGLPFPSPGDLPSLGIEPRYPALQADSGMYFHIK